MILALPFHSLPSDAAYEPPIDMRWGVTDEICGARRFCSNRVMIPPRSNNQHHFHLGCEALIFFTHGNWEFYRGIARSPIRMGPGACVHIPPGEPHSYANLDDTDAAGELAFYGMIPHRRFAETHFIDRQWVDRGRVVEAPAGQLRPWQPQDSEGEITVVGPDEGDVDTATLPAVRMRWTITAARCKAREIVGGVGTLEPGATTGALRIAGAEAMLYLLDGVLEVRGIVGDLTIVAPETFVYLAQGQVFRLRNPDQWRTARFFVSCGGIADVGAMKVEQAH